MWTFVQVDRTVRSPIREVVALSGQVAGGVLTSGMENTEPRVCCAYLEGDSLLASDQTGFMAHGYTVFGFWDV